MFGALALDGEGCGEGGLRARRGPRRSDTPLAPGTSATTGFSSSGKSSVNVFRMVLAMTPPRRPQDAPGRPQEAPGRPQNAPGTPKIVNFSQDFASFSRSPGIANGTLSLLISSCIVVTRSFLGLPTFRMYLPDTGRQRNWIETSTAVFCASASLPRRKKPNDQTTDRPSNHTNRPGD